MALLLSFTSLALASACKDPVVPDLNNPTIPESGVITNPTVAQVSQMAIGLLEGNRINHAARIRDMEIIGRNAYNLDGADPRWAQEMLAGTLTPGGFGNRHWLEYYSNIRIANILLRSLATASAERIPDGQKAGVRGFANTIKALDLIHVYETHENTGFPTDVGVGVDDLKPIVCAGPALVAIATLLDDAETDLRSAGAAFPFALPDGFAGFDEPGTFVEFNRALKAKVAIYQGNYALALTELGESFVATTEPLALGVYHNYSVLSGDRVNDLVSGLRTIRAHPSVVSDAESNDRRVTAKIGTGDELSFATPQGTLRSDLVFTNYPSLSSPIPIIRNEELMLLRAEANWFGGSKLAAIQDINTIRQTSGGLGPSTLTIASSDDAFITELLRQKRYSLLYETGSRWVDTRRLNKFDTLPLDRPGDLVHPRFPISQAETNARGGNITCVNTP